MSEFDLSADTDVIVGELEAFHYQNGGWRLQPKIDPDVSGQNLTVYRITDNDEEASILLQPTVDGCRITVNTNDSHRWGWRLGVAGRSELGQTTYLASQTSPRCEAFCDAFITYLKDAGYLDIRPAQSNGGRPPHPDDEWARDQVHNQGRDKSEVFHEWVERPGVKERDLQDSRDSYKKMIKSSPRS